METNQNLKRASDCYIYGTCYTQTKDQDKQLIYQKAVIFIQEQQKHYFNIVLQNYNDNREHKVFKLQTDYMAFYDIQKGNQAKLQFYLPIKQNQNLVIEAVFEESQLQRLGNFKEIYCRCVFEEKHEQSSLRLSNAELEKEVFCFMKKKDTAQKQSDKIKKVEQFLNDEKTYPFIGVGFLAKGTQNSQQQPQVMTDPAVLTIKMNGFSQYKLIVFDESQQMTYSKNIDYLFQRQIEEIDNSFMWIDQDVNGTPFIYYFKFDEVNLRKLDQVLTKMDYETNRNQSFQDNQDFMQYYDQPTFPGMYQNEYQNNQNFHFQQNVSQDPNESVLNYNNDFIKEFEQLKTKNKILINKNDGLQILDNQNLNVQQDFQLRDQKNNIFNPENIHMLDHDNKFISQGSQQLNSAFFADLNAEKVVREYKDEKGDIKDLTPFGGKEAVFGNDNTFLTLSNQNITHFDPRQAKPVNERFYKSVKGLNNIYAPKQGNFVIASENGELRTYDKVGGNARNVIPSYTQSKAIDIDSDKTGNLLLMTFQNNIQLFPMKQDGVSCFAKTFKKDQKPKPFNLKIHPTILAKYGMSKPEYKSAKFNEKLNDSESAIVAVCGKLQVFWNLNDVLRGETVTSSVQKMSDDIVKSEFQFNGNKTFTAFKNKFILSKCGEFN